MSESAGIHALNSDNGAGALQCVPCSEKGHVCYAHHVVDGQPQCIYCLDGEKCFFERRSKKITQEKKAEPLKHLEETLNELENSGLTPRARRSAIKKEKTVQTSKANGRGGAQLRNCKCGCGGQVPADFRFSYLKGHKKHVVKAGKKRNKGPQGVVANVAHVAPVAPTAIDSGDRISLSVSERQLNGFLLKLSFEEKQHLANYYLRQVDVA